MENRRTHRRAATGIALGVLVAAGIVAGNPSWWSARTVIDPGATPNDYGIANLGQLKWMATNACDELEARLPGGAGPEVWDMVRPFSKTGNGVPVNLGQLKNVAAPIYERLIEVGYTNAYPWTETTADDNDFAPANVGQLKRVFSFDISVDTDADGLYDWWEQYRFQDLDETYAGDADGDGFTNGEEYAGGSDPTDPLSIPDAAVYVDAVNGNDSNDGTWNDPVQSVGKGTALAAGSVPYVFVYPGTYTGTDNRGMEIPNADLVIRGIGGRHEAEIDCEWRGGGGVFVTSGENGNVRIENIVITGYYANESPYHYSAIHAGGGTLHLVDCAIEDCSSGNYAAAAVQVSGGTAVVQRCMIGPENSDPTSFGIVGCSYGTRLTLESCCVVDNWAALAAIAVGGSVTIEGCTIADNASPAVNVDNYAPCEVRNSILWNDGYVEVVGGYYPYLLMSYSCVQGAASYTGTDLIDEDPQLDENYHLTPYSPCLEAGDPEGGSGVDIDGEPRPGWNWIDIGADEIDDFDRDNMPDAWEQQIVNDNLEDEITDISQVLPFRDYDQDGLANFLEYITIKEYYAENPAQGPDPTENPGDDDEDGLSDDLEAYYGTDPSDAKSFDDRISDLIAVGLGLWHHSSDDFDKDGLANFDEESMGTDMFEKDSDGDGATDGEEATGEHPSNPADPADEGKGVNCTKFELTVGDKSDGMYTKKGHYFIYLEGHGNRIIHRPGALYGSGGLRYALIKGRTYSLTVKCRYCVDEDPQNPLDHQYQATIGSPNYWSEMIGDTHWWFCEGIACENEPEVLSTEVAKPGTEHEWGAIPVHIVRTDMIAYRPQNFLINHRIGFPRTKVPDDKEEIPGAGIRVNGSDSGKNLVEVELGLAPTVSGVSYFLKRQNSSLKVWEDVAKTTAVLDANDEEDLSTLSAYTYPLTVWVEYVPPATPGGATPDCVLSLEARDVGGTVVCSDKVDFYPFKSVVVGLAGEYLQIGGVDILLPDPEDNGMRDPCTTLYEEGYDVHYFDEDAVTALGYGEAYDLVEDAVFNREVVAASIFGHSHGGGSTHDICNVLDNAFGAGTTWTLDIPFTATANLKVP